MRNTDQVTIGDIYGDMLKKVKTITESKAPKTQKVGKPGKNAFNTPNPLKDGGPSEKGGYCKALNDKEEDEEDKNKDDENYYGVGGKGIATVKEKIKNEKDPAKKAKLEAQLKKMGNNAQITSESKKIARERLNTFMTKKSTFDKLVESVLNENWMNSQEDAEAQEVDALGLGDEPTDDEVGDDFGSEEDDQVTVTMSRSVAQELMALLQAAVGDETEDMLEGEGEDDGLDFGDEGLEDEDENTFEEDEETETIGAKDSKGGGETHKLQQKGNMKVQGKPQPKGSQTANAKVTDKTGTEYSTPAYQDGKNNKVSNIRQATDYFQ